MDMDRIHQKITEKAKDGKIACRQCFEIAQEHGVSLKAIGDACNEKSIRITACQLGCFK